MESDYKGYIDDPGQYIKKVHREWEKFINSKDITGLEVRREILKSWKNTLNYGLLNSEKVKLVYNDEDMEMIYVKNKLLISAAEPILNEFTQMLRKLGNNSAIINLTSKDTVILKTFASGNIAERELIYQHLIPGAILDEQYSGTTGVAMVKNTLQPYAIYGSEHFLILAKPYSSVGAPVRNIRTNEMIGIIAMSAINLKISPDTMGMITFVARTIESKIYSEYLIITNVLTEKYKEVSIRSKADVILAVDINLNIICSSKIQHPLLSQLYNKSKLTENLDNIIISLNAKYRENYRSQEKNTLSFYTQDYTYNVSPVYYDNGLAGIILYAYPIEQILKKTKKLPSTIKNSPIMIGNNHLFLEALETAKKVAATDASVMILGETGVGKEGFARTIYSYSNRYDRPFIAVNCGAIPKELIGSELFGYAPGAFTGALAKGSTGKIEAANGGTLFLDELGELPLDAQTYLLRVLEENEIVRLGSNETISIDVRIITATNANIYKLVKEKKFRSDLYFRLNVINIKIPSLRERFDDLYILINHFNSLYSGHGCVIDKADLDLLMQYPWDGNIRELRNVIQSANILGKNTVTALKEYILMHLNQKNVETPNFIKLKDNSDSIMKVIESCNGNISEAARQLGVARSTIYRHIKKNG